MTDEQEALAMVNEVRRAQERAAIDADLLSMGAESQAYRARQALSRARGEA